jgi:hypothetical protein
VRVRNSTKPARAYATDCPQLAKADMGVLTSGSGFDLSETLDVHCGNGFDTDFSPLSKHSFEVLGCRLLS